MSKVPQKSAIWRIAGAMLCAGIVLASSSDADEIEVSFPESPRFPVFAPGESVAVSWRIKLDHPERPEKVVWKVSDYLGQPVKSGEFNIPAGNSIYKNTIYLDGLVAGYFEVNSSLENSGTELPRFGSRPPGMATFGIRSLLAPLSLAYPSDSRFGIQGTTFLNAGKQRSDGYNPFYSELGVHWVNVNRAWHYEEPEYAGQYQDWLSRKPPMPWRKEQRETDWMVADQLAPLVCQYTIPKWNLNYPPNFKPGKERGYEPYAYGAKDYAPYRVFMEAVARNAAAEWTPLVPSVYYKIGWEPDWHWKGNDAEFVQFFTETYNAIKKGDPNAVVLGPSYALIDRGANELERLLPLGLSKALDGIDIHGYFIARKGESGNPFNQYDNEGNVVGMGAPEHPKVAEGLRKIRSLMAQYLKPDAKLFQTEWGRSYWPYKLKEITPEIIRTQAAYNTRGHIVFLGEGCDVTYFFHATDHASNLDSSGGTQGLCFNLDEKPAGGATLVSPKPNFMAASTLTRVLEGTKTIGPVDFKETAIAAYLFKRGDGQVLAIWSKDDKDHEIPVKTGVDKVTRVDFMGNVTELSSPGGSVTIKAGKYPQYILGLK